MLLTLNKCTYCYIVIEIINVHIPVCYYCMLENYFSSLKDSNKLKGGMYQNSILTGYSNVLYSLFYILSY